MAQAEEWTPGRAQSLKGLEPLRLEYFQEWHEGELKADPGLQSGWTGSSGAKPHLWGGIQEPHLWAAGWQAASSLRHTLRSPGIHPQRPWCSRSLLGLGRWRFMCSLHETGWYEVSEPSHKWKVGGLGCHAEREKLPALGITVSL